MNEEANSMLEASLPVCQVDAQGTCTLCSASFAALLGKTPAEVAGRPVSEMLGGALTAPEANVTLQGAAWRAISTPLLGEHGEVQGAVLSLQPATPVRRADTELQSAAREHAARTRVEETQRRLAFLFDATTSLFEDPRDPRQTLDQLSQLLVPHLADWCFIDVAAEGGPVERAAAAHWNPEHDRLARSMVRPLRVADPGVGRVLRTGEPELLEESQLPADDAAEDLALLRQIGARCALIVPIRLKGKPWAALTLAFSDSTRRYGPEDVVLVQDLATRAAMALRNGLLFDELQRAILARDDTLSVVSHDLRSPLSAFMLQIQRLARLLPDDTRAGQARQLLRKMEHTLRGMDGLIGNLLDLARIEAGRLQLERKPQKAAAFVGRALEPYETLASQKSVRLALEIPGSLPDIWCDPVRMAQVLSNLVGNALKFTPEGGSIRVAAAPSGDSVRFSVIDSGTGIAPDLLPHIFDRFWQPKESARRGYGLGLFIVKGIVEAHGGRVWVESEPDRGSRFHFTVPTSEQASRQPSQPSTSPGPA